MTRRQTRLSARDDERFSAACYAAARAVTATLAVALAVSSTAGASPSTAPRIGVNRAVAPWDAPFELVVSRLAPHERAVVRASTVDDAGKPWVSSAAIRADGGGRAVLLDDAALRLLWSLHPPSAGPADYYHYVPPSGGERVRLTLEVAGRAVATAAVTRRLLAPGERVRALRPARNGFYGELFEPRRTRIAHAAVVLFGGSEGGLTTGAIAAALAAHGYPTLALAYFGEPGLPKNLLRIPLEYFAGALRWLGSQPGVDRGKLAVAGISRGSEAAQLLGVHYPGLVHAVVALVPSNAPVCGIPHVTGSTQVHCLGPAWTFRDRAIPYSDAANPFATDAIPDERIRGPVFLDCGGQDALWPSCLMAHAIVTRLRAHHFGHPVTLLEYADAGHGVGFVLPYDPIYLPTGGTIAADQRARAVVWPRLLAFLRSL
jgi:dienelactone hydrolase